MGQLFAFVDCGSKGTDKMDLRAFVAMDKGVRLNTVPTLLQLHIDTVNVVSDYPANYDGHLINEDNSKLIIETKR
ncbi:hypothetical protein CEXT_33111 [Caerostris extrusa]|uniref:Uncharacterized protein n=1 Tax=Caerostris extrusa TaxID=172846 RepID=A0AAV4W5A0_CAEEX|nr:hypothetical protein CEXT_33111 [Caerostris extrusa]